MSKSEALAPTGIASVVPDKNPLSAEGYTEYERLCDRVRAQPTSEQARQELSSFKALNKIP